MKTKGWLNHAVAGLAAIVLLAGVPAGVAEERSSEAKEEKVARRDIHVQQAEKLLAGKEEVVVLDVRTPREVRGGRLKEARHLNIQDADFERQLAKLDRQKTYLVYCAVGGRSATAGEKMIEMGFTSVFNLEGGIRAWQRAGKPIER